MSEKPEWKDSDYPRPLDYKEGYADGLAEGRRKGLEEAAAVCSDYAPDLTARSSLITKGRAMGAGECAAAIRALIKEPKA